MLTLSSQQPWTHWMEEVNVYACGHSDLPPSPPSPPHLPMNPLWYNYDTCRYPQWEKEGVSELAQVYDISARHRFSCPASDCIIVALKNGWVTPWGGGGGGGGGGGAILRWEVIGCYFFPSHWRLLQECFIPHMLLVQLGTLWCGVGDNKYQTVSERHWSVCTRSIN